MTGIPKIILPHGGYRNLIVYKKSDVIYEGTVMFCRRFLPAHGDRIVDQMVQAARSCKQNIAEGSAASGTSKETEIKLTGVARATLDELMLTLCHQTRYMLDKMLARQEADHKKFGGVREECTPPAPPPVPRNGTSAFTRALTAQKTPRNWQHGRRR